MKSISDKTLIPVGVALLVIGGGTTWLTNLYNRVEVLAGDNERITSKQDVMIDSMYRIEERLASIEGELKRIKK